MTDHDDARGARPVLVLGEESPQRRLHAERTGKVRGDDLRLHALDLPVVRDVEAGGRVRRQLREAPALRAPIMEVRDARAHPARYFVRTVLPDEDQSLRLAIRQRTKQN